MPLHILNILINFQRKVERVIPQHYVRAHNKNDLPKRGRRTG